MAARKDVEIIRFPATVNMSEAIRNAASVPGTAKNPNEGVEFVQFLLTSEGRGILMETGQPRVVPALRKGDVPPAVKDQISASKGYRPLAATSGFGSRMAGARALGCPCIPLSLRPNPASGRG